MDLETIKICLSQKVIHITNMMDYTKQIEVKSTQDDAELSELIVNRSICIERIEKCNQLLQNTILSFEDNDQTLINQILNREIDINQCDDQMKEISDLNNQYYLILNKTNELDIQAKIAVSEKYDQLKNRVNSYRKKSVEQKLHH